MDPNDFRIRKDLYFPYTPKEWARVRGWSDPIENKPVAKCTNLGFEHDKNNVGLYGKAGE